MQSAPISFVAVPVTMGDDRAAERSAVDAMTEPEKRTYMLGQLVEGADPALVDAVFATASDNMGDGMLASLRYITATKDFAAGANYGLGASAGDADKYAEMSADNRAKFDEISPKLLQFLATQPSIVYNVSPTPSHEFALTVTARRGPVSG